MVKEKKWHKNCPFCRLFICNVSWVVSSLTVFPWSQTVLYLRPIVSSKKRIFLHYSDFRGGFGIHCSVCGTWPQRACPPTSSYSAPRAVLDPGGLSPLPCPPHRHGPPPSKEPWKRWCAVMVGAGDSGSARPGFTYGLWHLLAEHFWASYLKILNLVFLIWKYSASVYEGENEVYAECRTWRGAGRCSMHKPVTGSILWSFPSASSIIHSLSSFPPP